MSLTLKVKLGSPFFPLAIAKTLPPTFQTCDPPHWTTWVVAERARQNALNSPRVILPCFTSTGHACDFSSRRAPSGNASRGRKARPRANKRRRHDAGVVFNGFVAEPLRHRLDRDLRRGCDPGPLGHRQQAAQGIGKVGVDRGLRAAFHVSGHRHLWRRQSRSEERREQLATHIDLEACTLESFHQPFTTLAKERPVGNAAREGQHHLLEHDRAARTNKARQPPECGGRIGQIRQNESPDKGVELLVSRKRFEFRRRETHMIHSGCRGPLPCDRDRIPGAMPAWRKASAVKSRRYSPWNFRRRNSASE